MENHKNRLIFKPDSGPMKGKSFLYEESNHRWGLLRAYVKNRKPLYKDAKFLLVKGITGGKWSFSLYSESVHHKKLPIPDLVVNIQTDKIYRLKQPLSILR